MIALIELIPGKIRNRTQGVNPKIEQLFRKIMVNIDGVIFAVSDEESIDIVNLSYETFITKWLHFRSGDVFVDIGAHVGKFVFLASRAVGNQGHVIGVEPHPSNFALLMQNVKSNKAGNVKVFNFAAWDTRCSLKLFVGPNSATSNVNRHNYGNGCFEAQADKMDVLLLNRLHLDKVDWVKIDVEGAEYNVLLGLQETMKRFRPTLIIELWSRNAEKVKALLTELNYSLADYSEVNESESQQYINVLCLPNSLSYKSFMTNDEQGLEMLPYTPLSGLQQNNV